MVRGSQYYNTVSRSELGQQQSCTMTWKRTTQRACNDMEEDNTEGSNNYNYYAVSWERGCNLYSSDPELLSAHSLSS